MSVSKKKLNIAEPEEKLSRVGNDLLSVPIGTMIKDLALGIADAQVKLDENSIDVAEMMGGLQAVVNDKDEVEFQDSRVFFGEETVSVKSAVITHNTSTDQVIKAKLKETLTTNPTFSSHVSEISTGPKAGNLEIADPNHPDLKTLNVSIPLRLSMMELGFTPTFYQFVDTMIEIKVNIKFHEEDSTVRKEETKSRTVDRFNYLGISKGKISRSRGRTVTTSQVNGTYSSKYSFTAEGSSLLRTKLVPVPPPSILEERIRLMMNEAETKPDPS